MVRTAAAVSLSLFLLTGCGKEIEAAKQAAAAAAALSEQAQNAQKASEKAEEAGEAAAKEAAANIPPGTDPEVAKQQIEMAKAFGAMGAMAQAQGTGPIVNWRQLQPFFPDAIGEFAAKSDFKGKTNSMGGMKVTNGERRYEAGERKAKITITDTHLAGMMRAPFQMAAMVQEDSSDGYKKGTKVAGHTAIVEWHKNRKNSKAMLLVADRYMMEVNVRGTTTPDDAEKLAVAIGLDKLAALQPQAE